ncbi:hypothetical protein N9B82_01780 [Saprospiraceae bacterium]|nr:hypothetical protein [Saprospiraceae bacterium]
MKHNIFRGLILILVLSFSFSGVFAQNEDKNLETIVVLKSGSRIVGTLISYDPNEETVLKIGENLITLPAESIKKVVMPASKKRVNINRIQTKKVYHRTNMGLLSNANGNGITLNYSALYQHSRWLGVGLGTGIDNYYFSSGRNVYPLFIELKSYLVDGNASPYVSIKSGYGFIATNENESQTNTKGGMIINPNFGYRLGSTGMIVDIYIGLRFQSAEYDTNNGWNVSHQEIQWNRVETGIGISF